MYAKYNCFPLTALRGKFTKKSGFGKKFFRTFMVMKAKILFLALGLLVVVSARSQQRLQPILDKDGSLDMTFCKLIGLTHVEDYHA